VKSDGSQAYTSACRAAIITEVPDGSNFVDSASVGLCVLNPTGQFFSADVQHDQGTDVGEPEGPFCGGRVYHGGSWHWPDRD
jgi:hypothetical protein